MPKSTTPTTYTRDVSEHVAKTLQVSKKDALLYTETVINTIVEELIAGHKVNLNALGIFQVKETKERKVRNPKTNELFVKPPYRKLTMKATKVMKTRLN